MTDTTSTPGEAAKPQPDVTPIPKTGAAKSATAKATKAAGKATKAPAKAAKAVKATKAAKAKTPRASTRADAVGEKKCKTCGIKKPMQSFPTLSTPRKDGSTRGDECRGCRDDRAKANKATKAAAAK